MVPGERSSLLHDPPGTHSIRWWVVLTVVVSILVGAIAVELRRPDQHVATSGSAAAASSDWAPERLAGERFSARDRSFVLSYAYPGQDWADELLADRDRARAEVDPVTGWRLLDLRSRYLNITGGRRASLEPADPNLTVWYFGGSTMFGSSQRDDHTIPSEIARLAEADGVRVRSENFGVESYNNYQETMAFAAALSTGRRPDLVVFYDGANELATAVERVDVGRTDPGEIYYQAASAKERKARGESSATRRLTAAQRDDLAVKVGGAQYRRGVLLGQQLGGADKIPVVHVWQPVFAATPPPPVAEPVVARLGLDDESLASVGGLYRRVLQASKVKPIDLFEALGGVEEPTFFDFEHTNELGASLVAKALYERLRPQFTALAH
ncbi:hypothetical protein [Aquihabitans sp. McL0605]|uniref:hypothetical protein n=1 Tax=Aquihabitans sp. McL0605 TaxID=3415671 RepID=UPI003CF495B4